MKTTKTTQLSILTALLLLLFQLPSLAQEHKIPMSEGIISLEEINEVSVQGYDGNEIVITTTGDFKLPERAKGLKPLNAMGLTDNTGLGLGTKKEGNTLIVFQVARNNDAKYFVKVPRKVMVNYKNTSMHGDDFTAREISTELEAQTRGGDIRLIDITGPVTANSVHGDIEISFSGNLNQQLPSSIATAHGDIDIAFPADAKANMNISSTWGEVYSDLDIEVEQKGEMKRYGAHKINGTLNGGGVAISISTPHGNVYLRKK